MSKLDRLVGTMVFGWSIKDGEPEQWRTLRITRLDCQYHETPVDSGPHFGSEIAAAWEVQAVMKAKGFKIHLEDYGNRYLANFASWCYDYKHNREHSNEYVAICLAALAALEVDDATIQEAMR